MKHKDRFDRFVRLVTFSFKYCDKHYIQCDVCIPYFDDRKYLKNVRLWHFSHLHEQINKQGQSYGYPYKIQNDVCQKCRKVFPSFESLVTSIRFQIFQNPNKLKAIHGKLEHIDNPVGLFPPY